MNKLYDFQNVALANVACAAFQAFYEGDGAILLELLKKLHELDGELTEMLRKGGGK